MRILTAEAGGQMPAAALTAYAIAQKQERAIEAGFQTHIVEPIEQIQLRLILANLAGSFLIFLRFKSAVETA
ncbi:hypothetical protein NDI47_07545 [Microcoleus vaginatus GB1-A2]|uniref:hypothetical protein n=1 Tax=Microcoleus vaginatus TaxID=119532 RepID=UPI0032AAA33D